ncbi:hypothetical protein AJ80_02707 [Polytolypa hystricis UAMH7299]|uniref:Uncharacterized protein n=1 Tax=Polytolypa hystricis (strain UAMH7299) TaxID=1447883 RepID=A0A2B7YQF4_POLH7|nr:hypothetical protein AJ80_02707 [Polytolypa hystricis UAMH7299]
MDHLLSNYGVSKSEIKPRQIYSFSGLSLTMLIFAVRLLLDYSMIESIQSLEGYATHPVVRKWALNMPYRDQKVGLARLAVIVVGPLYWLAQRRLLGLARCCSQWLLGDEVNIMNSQNKDFSKANEQGDYVKTMMDAIHNLGNLYANQSELDKAKVMY